MTENGVKHAENLVHNCITMVELAASRTLDKTDSCPILDCMDNGATRGAGCPLVPSCNLDWKIMSVGASETEVAATQLAGGGRWKSGAGRPLHETE